MPSTPAQALRMILPRWWLLDVQALRGPLSRTLIERFVETMLGPA